MVTIVEFLIARLDEDEAQFDLTAEAEAESLRNDGMPDTTAQDSVVLRHMASVYADHPDYKQEWKP